MAEPIAQRIRNAFRKGETALSYHELLGRVFPSDQYPNAWRYSSNGGPPGCAMAFRKALNKLGMREFYPNGHSGAGFFLRPKSEDAND